MYIFITIITNVITNNSVALFCDDVIKFRPYCSLKPSLHKVDRRTVTRGSHSSFLTTTTTTATPTITAAITAATTITTITNTTITTI